MAEEQPNLPVGEVKTDQSNPSLYQKLQSERDKLREEVERLKEKVDLDDRIPAMERRMQDLSAQVVQAEALISRNRLIQEKYPELKGYEEFIPLGTEKDMEEKAKKLQERVLNKPSSETSEPSNEPLKSPVDSTSSGPLSDEQFEDMIMNAPTKEKAKELFHKYTGSRSF